MDPIKDEYIASVDARLRWLSDQSDAAIQHFARLESELQELAKLSTRLGADMEDLLKRIDRLAKEAARRGPVA